MERVRQNTPDKINRQIDDKTRENIVYYAGKNPDQISARIRDLEEEWGIERVLETNMSVLALSGVALTAFTNKKWLVLPTVVLGFFLQHALQGWCPPLPLFRKLGYRTQKEIERERYALKAFRGDFDDIHSQLYATKDVGRVLEAVNL